MPAPEDKIVREFRPMLLWPLQLRRLSRTSGFNHPLGPWEKTAIFLLVFIPAIALTELTVRASRRPATFMEALASERMTWVEKTDAFRQIWSGAKRARQKRVAGGDAPTRPASRPHREQQTAVSSSD